MIPNLDKILKEWSYRVGVIDYKDDAHLYHLNKILEERGWSKKVIDEITYKLKNGTKLITEAATNRTEDLHEIFFAIAFAGGDINRAKDLKGLKQVINGLRLKLDNKNKHIETLVK